MWRFGQDTTEVAGGASPFVYEGFKSGLAGWRFYFVALNGFYSADHQISSITTAGFASLISSRSSDGAMGCSNNYVKFDVRQDSQRGCNLAPAVEIRPSAQSNSHRNPEDFLRIGLAESGRLQVFKSGVTNQQSGISILNALRFQLSQLTSWLIRGHEIYISCTINPNLNVF